MNGGVTVYDMERQKRRDLIFPDLLHALKAAEGHLAESLGDKAQHPIGHCPVLDLVRAAIAKAEGA